MAIDQIGSAVARADGDRLILQGFVTEDTWELMDIDIPDGACSAFFRGSEGGQTLQVACSRDQAEAMRGKRYRLMLVEVVE